MATAKRAYKLQEFVAHISNINCLTIGKRTCRLLVTGGENRKVNLWTIGKPNSKLNLSGHTIPIESVCLVPRRFWWLLEQLGARQSCRIWKRQKILRTLTCHRSNST